MADPIPSGRILVTGPTGSGKTRTTATMMQAWVAENGPDGVVVLEFAPEHDPGDGTILGRRMNRFIEIPDAVDYHEVHTRAPRAASTTLDEALTIAKQNQAACHRALKRLPKRAPAIFVNDATMAFHVPGATAEPLTRMIRTVPVAVVNALQAQGFDPTHPITQQEKRILEQLQAVVDRTLRLQSTHSDEKPMQKGANP